MGSNDKNSPQNNDQNTEPKTISFWQLITLVIIGLALVLLANGLVFLSDTANDITIAFEDSGTFSVFDDKLTFVVDNDKKSNIKNVYIYGIGNATTVTLSASKIIEQNLGKTVELRFDGNEFTTKNIGTEPNITKISLIQVDSGIYHGSMFVTNEEKTSVPLTVDIKPHITHPIMIVVDGIVISAVFWKLLKFFDDRNGQIYVRGALVADKPQTRRTLMQYIHDRKVTKGVVLSNGLLDFGTMIFGIAVGMTALFNDSFVIGIHDLGIYEIISLIGMGLGIESVKEFLTNNTPVVR